MRMFKGLIAAAVMLSGAIGARAQDATALPAGQITFVVPLAAGGRLMRRRA